MNYNRVLVFVLFLIACMVSMAFAQIRIKDVSSIQGARDNQLIGYGLVVGLSDQGDSDPLPTQRTVANLMQRFGIVVSDSDITSGNVAAVMVTATIPAFARNGSKLDVNVASVADAKSLQGGTLLQTPLIGADGNVYAVAQGNIALGGFLASGTNASIQKNHPTSGRIPGGAIVEQEIPTNIFANGVLELNLREGDFTSAVRMANAINEQMSPIAHATSSRTVRVYVPEEFQPKHKQMEFVARVENVVFRPDSPARIVINEKTGTIVANSNIRIHKVAVAHGNLTVSIANKDTATFPNPFTGNVGDIQAGNAGNSAAASGVVGAAPTPLIVGNAPNQRIVYEDSQGNQIQVPIDQDPPVGFNIVMVPGTGQSGVSAPGGQGGNVTVTGPQPAITTDTSINATETKAQFIIVDELPTIDEVATGLNRLGVTPRDMMSIFQAMKEAGALQAELVMQ